MSLFLIDLSHELTSAMVEEALQLGNPEHNCPQEPLLDFNEKICRVQRSQRFLLNPATI